MFSEDVAELVVLAIPLDICCENLKQFTDTGGLLIITVASSTPRTSGGS